MTKAQAEAPEGATHYWPKGDTYYKREPDRKTWRWFPQLGKWIEDEEHYEYQLGVKLQGGGNL